MIETITVCNDASYSDPQPFDGLKKINFVFGANGSGKTTISRLIADPASFPRAAVAWRNNRPLEALVYNSDFVERTFVTQLKGIFTLGEENADTLEKIEQARGEVDQHQAEIDKLAATLGLDGNSGKRKELAELRNGFEEQCWQLKQRHDAHFKGAFEGLRSKKAAFCDRVLKEQTSNSASLGDVENLKARAETIFDAELERISSLDIPVFDDLAASETHSILGKKIVGKEDVDVAALIRRLGNSDWVKEGIGYLQSSGEQCPFCQQAVNADLERRLNEYFDETYMSDLAALNSLAETYRSASSRVLEQLDALLASECSQLDITELKAERDRLGSRFEANLRLIEKKQKEPSSVTTLKSSDEITARIQTLLSNANTAIDTHNRLVANHADEKRNLTAEIWKYLLDEDKVSIKAYLDAKSGLDKAVDGLNAGIAARTAQRDGAKQTLSGLEKSITSVQPTVNEINTTLESFGFTGFKLRTAGEQNHLYEIVREDGSNASSTLSEGEKSFICFLYFYNLIRGSHSASGMTGERVVVFDDPVSSLDSDVLFIVSALIKRLLESAKEDSGSIRQVFLLTHNIYFHKEVAFDPKRGERCRAHETFWIVRKSENQSQLQSYDHNPIRTSYELLWEEVRNPQRSKVSIQNTLRRILENYFTILGNRDKDSVIEQFNGRDKQICASLYSWVNDGSHSAYDDCFISLHDEQIDRYLDVFRRIFEVTNHKAHYDMMMRIEEGEGPQAVEITTGTVEARAAN